MFKTLYFPSTRMLIVQERLSRHLNGGIGRRTSERWYKMIRQTGAINLSKPLGCPRIARTKTMVRKVKDRLKKEETNIVQSIGCRTRYFRKIDSPYTKKRSRIHNHTRKESSQSSLNFRRKVGRIC